MTLTMASGPLSRTRPDTVNYRIEGPEHLLFFEDFPRRVRAVLAGETIAETSDGKLLHETGLLPVLYFPEADVRFDHLEPSDRSTHCPFKGDASYWSARAGDRRAPDAVWSYRQPFDAAGWLKGYLAVEWDAMDEWFDEDERIEGHLRDPYHRVDVRRSTRHVGVLWGDQLIAETRQPRLLSETGLPNRFYLPPDSIGTGTAVLEPSDTRTICPYKGTATYWSLRAGDEVLTDAAWSYEEPLENASKVPGHLCFSHDALSIEVDGERVE